ncbi:MAG: hypothetical protein KC731_23085 [Myxococcales bacterium]|nr:hypothetical protein [Myxococcales bacterium]
MYFRCFLVWAAGLALAMGNAACGGGLAEDYCNKVCDCFGVDCSGDVLDACVEEFDKQRKPADDAGCSAEFDEAFGCLIDTITCDGGEFQFDQQACNDEAITYGECVGESAPQPG